jgi:RNA polymerase sigma factor (sigma-70 family)
MNPISLSAMPDDQLWQRSREGDRAAFGQIVERYQSLICSLAYSACGNLARSEDLGQETFITAWQQLDDLREPAKLRPWLCGIVRNLSASTLRREQRRGGPAKSLSSVVEPAASNTDPAAQAVTQEEAALLWRSLAGLPESYREPMVLFYRQGQSIAEVAQLLDLSDDAVKQRLARGRSMLRDELASVVETTLGRTRPARAFTAAVLAVLPVATPQSAEAALVANVASGTVGATAKGVLAGLSKGVFVGPAIGLVIALLSSKAAASTARTAEERTCILRYSRRMIIVCFAMSIALVLGLSQLSSSAPASPIWVVFGILAWVAVLVFTVMWMCSQMHQEVLRIRRATGTTDEAYGKTCAEKGLKLAGPLTYESKARLLGFPLISVACGGADVDTNQTRRAIGWLAVGDIAISPLVAVGGIAIAPFCLGLLTVGIISFSVWGIALGALAFGTVAAGIWAYGLAALGWQAAAGGAVMAREYAVGLVARAAEANTPVAKEWFASQWFSAPVDLFLHNVHWVMLLVLLAWLTWKLCRSLKLVCLLFAIFAAGEPLAWSRPPGNRHSPPGRNEQVASRPAVDANGMPVNKGIVPANGIMLAYESFGSEDRESVLLIMGTAAQLTAWPVELCEELVSRGYRVVRYDHRDVGLSTRLHDAGKPDYAAIEAALKAGKPAPLPYLIDDMAKDAVGLLDALNIKTAHIVGMSMGGAIAQLVAADHAEYALSLTCIGASTGNPALPQPKPEVWAALMTPMPPEGDWEAIAKYRLKIERALGSPGYPTNEKLLRDRAIRDAKRAWYPAGAERHAVASFVADGGATDRRGKLNRINVPTVVLQGADDPIVLVTDGQDVAENIPGAELRIVPGMGHDIPLALIDTFADAIAAAASRANRAKQAR